MRDFVLAVLLLRLLATDDRLAVRRLPNIDAGLPPRILLVPLLLLVVLQPDSLSTPSSSGRLECWIGRLPTADAPLWNWALRPLSNPRPESLELSQLVDATGAADGGAAGRCCCCRGWRLNCCSCWACCCWSRCLAAVNLLATDASLPGWWWCSTLPGMRFAGTRNTLRWSLDASAELLLTLCFTVPVPMGAPPATEPAPATIPFRAPFLRRSPRDAAAATAAAAAGVDTGVVGAATVVPDWFAEGTRLSGEVVHFNSMTLGRPLLALTFLFAQQ